MIVEIVAAASSASAVAGYVGAAYRYGWPSPFASRHERVLRKIASLEADLYPPAQSPTMYGDALAAEKYAAYTQVSASPYASIWPPQERRAIEEGDAYDGPALTDEDVRRLEHPEEFR